MKKFILILTFLLIGCNGCFIKMDGLGTKINGSDNVIKENRQLRDFHTVHILGSLDAEIAFGDTFSCKVKGADNLVPFVETAIRNNTLIISIEENYSTKSPLVIYLTMPVLEKAKIIGSGDITISDVTKDKVTLIISGSGDILASGNVDLLEAVVSGSGDLSLQNLRANHANITINGSGDAEVWANQSISARVNGSGDIIYSGDPVEVDTQVNGSGKITKK